MANQFSRGICFFYFLIEKEKALEEIFKKILEWATLYGIKFIGAIAIFLIGKFLTDTLTDLVKKLLKKAKIDPTLVTFLGNLTYLTLMTFVIISVLSNLGVQTASIIAIFGASALAVGLALQGSLSDFANGVMIVLFKPLKVGDLVDAGGASGHVEEIRVFNTIICTLDSKTVIVPNSKITGDKIINFSTKGYIRVDLVFGIGYNDDIRKAKKVLEEIMASDDRVLEDPPSCIALSELGDSSVNFVFRPHVKVEDYWDVYFDMTEKVKLRFDKEGISIPYPQRDVHIYEKKTNN